MPTTTHRYEAEVWLARSRRRIGPDFRLRAAASLAEARTWAATVRRRELAAGRDCVAVIYKDDRCVEFF